jgi:ABC-type transport system involved in multi-copper enzyme maturation permease subunit
MTGTTTTRSESLLTSAWRIFGLSIGEMLWSRRTIFMALVVGSPIVVALVARVVQSMGTAPLRVNGVQVDAVSMFGAMIWILFLWFIVPVLGVFYGTSLIADEVDDKTITYLFTRPVRRGAVVVGKFIAYLVCTTLVVLPSVMFVYFLMVPFGQIPSSFVSLVIDLGVLGLGLAAYGALFALIGASLRRPLVVGLVFVFGWELVTLVMPGYLKRFTLAYYLQTLVPHSMPAGDTVSLLQGAVFRDPPSAAASVGFLIIAIVVSLGLAIRVVEQREYVLEQ